MTDAREEAGQQPAAPSAIDLFGSTSTSAEDDVFAQLSSADDQYEQEIVKQSAQQPLANSANHFPQLDILAPAPEKASTAIESQVEDQEQVNQLDNDESSQGVEVESAPVPATEPATLNDTDKDFSDLLAEFEAEQGDGETNPQSGQVEPVEQAQDEVAINSAVHESEPHPHPAPAHQMPAPAAVASLFADDSDAFDDLLGQSQPETDTDVALPIPASATASPSPVPSLSIEHSRIEDSSAARGDGGAAGDVSLQSMFSNASDWLGDTTVDDSFAIGDGETLQKVEQNDGDAPVTFEIPQGWYDDHGEWHWYTDEEKEQVRLTMLGQGGWDSAATEEVSADPSELAAPDSPALQTPGPMSENAARRTPVPEAASTSSSNAYDVYTPSSAQQSSYGGLSSSAYSSQPSPYAPSSSSSPYAPQPASTTTTTSYDPYAPTAFASASSPYAPASQVSGYLPQAGPSTASAPPAAPKPAPPKIQRMASNAYDPPFLRPQKSFIRPPAALPAASPAYGVPSTLAMSPPLPSTATPPPPPPPPSGPPRRKQTDDRPASRGPTFAPPPPKGPSRAPSVVNQSYGQEQAYRAPPMLPSVAAQQLYGLDQHSQPLRPPTSDPPQYNVTHDAFDPPIPSVASQQTHYTHQQHPQQAYAAPPRPPSALSRTSFASPPPRVASPSLAPPPAAQSSYGPPRPLSRGLPKRQHSPFFEAPPPRPEISQRMRSPPQAHRPSFEQVLSPPKTSEPLYSERRTSTDSQYRSGYDTYQGSSNAYSSNVNVFNANTHAKPPPIPSPHREEFPALSRRYDEEGEDMEDPYVSQTRDDSYGQGPEDQYDQHGYQSQE